MSHGESSTTKAAAMTRITFPPTEEAARALAAFSSGASAPALLELDLVNEHIHVTRVEEEGVARGDLQKFVRSDDARCVSEAYIHNYLCLFVHRTRELCMY